jgi:hypothetical protein
MSGDRCTGDKELLYTLAHLFAAKLGSLFLSSTTPGLFLFFFSFFLLWPGAFCEYIFSSIIQEVY